MSVFGNLTLLCGFDKFEFSTGVGVFFGGGGGGCLDLDPMTHL